MPENYNTILAISEGANRGKSQTLRKLIDIIIKEYQKQLKWILPPDRIDFEKYKNDDVDLVFEIDSVIFGILTKGDPSSSLEKRLIEMSQMHKCHVLICACRTSGETYNAVYKMAEDDTYGYNLIITSTYRTYDKDKQDNLNSLKANHLHELLRTLKLLK